MPEAPAAPPAAPPSAAPAIGTVPLGFGNVPSSPAFKRAADALDKLAGNEPPKPAAKADPKPADKPAETKPNDIQPITDQTPDDSVAKDDAATDDNKTPAPTETKESEKPKRPNPWKMLDEWKAKHATLEKELTELKGKSAKPADDPETKRVSERLTALEKENTELKEERKFWKYEQSDDYKAQYEKPYFDAWNSGRDWVARLNVVDGNGQERRGTPQDFDQIMDMSFANPEQASAILEQMFGPKASSVAAYIVDVQKAARKASDAIETFRKTGAEQEKQKSEAVQRQKKEIADHLSKTWAEANKTALEHPEYGEFFKPREGDAEWNQRLAKGRELAQRGFAEDPFAENLTPEQRKAIVQRHAAILNRAAAFGALRYKVKQLESQLKERDEALAAYEESEPKPGEANGRQTTTANGGSAKDRAMAALDSGRYNR